MDAINSSISASTSGGMTPNSFWRILDRDQMKIIAAAYEILRDVRMILEDDGLLRLAQKTGCSVDFEKKVAEWRSYKDSPFHHVPQSSEDETRRNN